MEEKIYKKEDLFTGPFQIENDNEYLPILKFILKELRHSENLMGYSDDFKNQIADYIGKVIELIEEYYQGKLENALSIAKELIVPFGLSHEFAVTTPLKSVEIGTNGASKCNEFFRFRVCDEITNYTGEEMNHVPFSKREIMCTQRFSISGLPSLYVGNTSYCCWLEMGKPEAHKFNVSPLKLPRDSRILNLVFPFQMFSELKQKYCNKSKSDENELILIKLMILNIATSFRVTQTNRTFKSEYVIPKCLMLACLDRGLDGIAYYSKRVENELYAAPAINITMFPKKDGKDDKTTLEKNVKIGNSFNYAIYKEIKNIDKSTVEMEDNQNLKDCKVFIDSAGTDIFYSALGFYDFDRYLLQSFKSKD